MAKMRCSVDGKESKLGMEASMMAAACAAVMSSPVVMALLDERMSMEGTGLPFGLSNNLLLLDRNWGWGL
ncbi:hypothetical protein ACS0TY_027789 [Phlomoides rotata]